MFCLRHQVTKQIKDSKKKPTIFNFVSGVESPLSWGKFLNLIYNNYNENPPLKSIWYIISICSSKLWVVYFFKFLLHWIPAALTDLVLIVIGRRPR